MIDDCSAAQLLPFVKNNVVAGSNILTDGWKGCTGLEKTFTHQQILLI